ncbi:hypothetical protein Fmac_008540 [Flemingia macrophylla]|uniref:Uncharacterized protein n=1 Tax=Flemingia macrophylla TaxID=520843 RepID=A0ABD1MXQ1_9FABA
MLLSQLISQSFSAKVSSVEIERICNGVDTNLLETAAIGVPPSGGGPELLTIAVVFKDSNSTKQDLHQLKTSFNSALQKKLNPLFKVSQVATLPSLPRTASNKSMKVLKELFRRLKYGYGVKGWWRSFKDEDSGKFRENDFDMKLFVKVVQEQFKALNARLDNLQSNSISTTLPRQHSDEEEEDYLNSRNNERRKRRVEGFHEKGICAKPLP